jgi:hypothetical protein
MSMKLSETYKPGSLSASRILRLAEIESIAMESLGWLEVEK